MSFKHDLGVVAKDKITGFKGIITQRVDYLTGCNRCYVSPRELKDNSIVDGFYFDEAQNLTVFPSMRRKLKYYWKRLD